MELYELLEQVHDASSFLAFARALEADSARAGAPDATDWENGTISDFLESAIAWAEAADFGESQGLSAQNPWRQFATFLYCGKIYE